MAKKVNITGKPARRIETTGKPQRRIEPKELAAALGAEPTGVRLNANLDPISLAALGTELLSRLRSTGGRPALADATEFCRVPLSSNDVKALEKMTRDIEQRTGAKPSVGQIASVIVRDYLSAARNKSEDPAVATKNESSTDSITALLPRLAEIANNADAVRKSASAIESTVKAIKEDADGRTD